MRFSMRLVGGALLAGLVAAAAPAEPAVDETAAPVQEAPDASAAADAAAPDAMPADEPLAVDESEPAAEAAPAAPDETAEGLAAEEEIPPAAPAPAAESLEETASAPLAQDADGEVAADAVEPMAPETSAPALGAIGYDAQGRPGRIHVVVRGDTLWDISNAYLGTPWIWPSIWQDNREIENPHWIYPGDRIWITPSEMRVISAEEAERLLAGAPAAPEPEPAPEPMVEEVPPPSGGMGAPERLPTHMVSSAESAGLITAEALESSATVVDNLPDRTMVAQGDLVYLGLGEGQAAVGDQFTVFRENEKVYDPDTGRLLGYHVDFLGWAEVREVFAETCLAELRKTSSEVEVGDRVMPRETPLLEIPVQPSSPEVEGKIAYFPQSRVLLGTIDFVYLNRGSLDGLEVGTPLQVYRPGRMAYDAVRGERLQVPDHVVADMLVVRVRPESSVALVRHTETELEIGDHFRGAN